ncbi:30S ribosomal protein S4 [Mycoplasma sp. E35C]|uniref:30S ribosomal protein S4 n=1 Tax=Mycoplasma sp. E35C TaxID=2801918 RepID=UPI001CA464F7|nr:30S ribosomal protein S4 [Mycoplasma sp. E35C]QZX48981.1 30S ribosomal protein S4 [Mycoplasma sp. E35C]
MSRYTGSIYRKARRLNFSILESGKEFTNNKSKKGVKIPGQHGSLIRPKLSNYGEQLQEKQKMQFMYGLNDRQFRRLFAVAKKMSGILTMNLFRTLESRLDNLVFRMGFAPTRRGARQLVNHGHVLVNGKTVDIASALIPLGSVIELKTRAQNLPLVKQASESKATAAFVEVNKKTFSGTYVRYPERNELPAEINETYVVEYYKRLVK